jgi:DNA-directed RNA polymerase subunit RPC12/RpoP
MDCDFKCMTCERRMQIILLDGEDWNPMWCPYCGSEELETDDAEESA